jgi:phosphate transport system substrate-binding protein
VNRNVLSGRVLAGVALVAIALAGCSSKNEPGTGSSDAPKLSGAVRVDGSSTVAPLSEAAADLYKAEQAGVQVTVATSGTGAGFEKFCNGETDISDASRPISQKEKDACAAKGIVYQELLAANDALTVVVNKQNDWVDCLTTAELKKIWEPSSAVTNWNQVRAGFPDQPLGQGQLFGAGTDSGTFDYFTEVINGKSKAAPCRIGTRYLHESVRRDMTGQSTAQPLQHVAEAAWQMNEGSICGLGQAAPLPLTSALEHWPEEFGR